MRVRFIRGTALGGIGNDAHPGDERDLPEGQAKSLISGGRAVVAPAELAPAETPPPAAPTSQTRKKRT